LPRPEVSFSFSFPGARPSAPTITTSQTSRSSSRVSQKSSVSERIAVFKDDGSEHEKGRDIASERGPTVFSQTTRHRVSSTQATNGAGTATLFQNDENHDPRNMSDADSSLNTTRLAQQLQSIAARRAELLRQLSYLQIEEAEVLAQLARSVSGFAEAQSSPQARRLVPSTSSRPLNAPLLPKPNPTISPSRLPRMQPSKASRKPLHTRTVSAPSVSTPSAARHRTPSTSKRVPLGDKSEETLALVEAGPLLGREPNPFRPLERSIRLADDDDTMNSQRSAATSQRTKTLRLPTNFGDDLESRPAPRLMPGTPRPKARPRSVSSTRGRGTSKSRSRSRVRNPATTEATPAVSRFYEVPHTVARKQWDF